MDTVWEKLVLLVSGIEIKPGNSLYEQIALENGKDKLKRMIENWRKEQGKNSRRK